MKFSFSQKLLGVLFGIQFAEGFMKEYTKNAGGGLTPDQLDYVTYEIVNCSVYQTLIREGKSPQEITDILDLRNISKEKFEGLTGARWPATK